MYQIPTSNIIYTEQAVFVYLVIYISTIKQKEAMNLNGNKVRSTWGKAGERKGKGANEVILILKDVKKTERKNPEVCVCV